MLRSGHSIIEEKEHSVSQCPSRGTARYSV